MISHYNRYRIDFQTKGPVFIGNGNTIGKKEYIYNRREGYVLLIEPERMLKALAERRMMSAYEAFVLNGNGGLYEFLREYQVPESEYRSWARTVIETKDPVMVNRSVKGVQEFIKDPYGLPYIPGSSFKGMLRTVFETAYYLEHPERAAYYGGLIAQAESASRNRYLGAENRKLSVEAFHRAVTDNEKLEDMVNDTMKGIRVSDGEPISPEAMCIAQKIDHGKSGINKDMPVLRECIRPETDLQIIVTIDTSVNNIDGNGILEAFRLFYRNYREQFMDKFPDAPKIRGNSTTFFLGGGTGYPSKTITYALSRGDSGVKQVGRILNETLPDKLRSQHGHADDAKRGVSPSVLKCTRYGPRKANYQMGACCITGVTKLKD